MTSNRTTDEKPPMITPDILPILRCPADGGPLVWAQPELVIRVNEAIKSGDARDQLDARVDTPIDAGLVNRSADRLYPVRDEIATIVAENAIRI
jgi:uncharacterized protein YbaR (Trm112 family)